MHGRPSESSPASTFSKTCGGWARTAATLALSAAVLFTVAGTAAAQPAGAAGPHSGTEAAQHVPEEVLEALCAHWESIAADHPVPSAPAGMCPLVNGWD